MIYKKSESYSNPMTKRLLQSSFCLFPSRFFSVSFFYEVEVILAYSCVSFFTCLYNVRVSMTVLEKCVNLVYIFNFGGKKPLMRDY